MVEVMYRTKVDLKEVGYEQGTRGWCPIANAIAYYQGATWVQVDENEIRLTVDGTRYAFRTPIKARAFIRLVDDAKTDAAVNEIRPFILLLTTSDLLAEWPAKVRSPQAKRAARARAIRHRAAVQPVGVLAAAGTTAANKKAATTKKTTTSVKTPVRTGQAKKALRGRRLQNA